MSDRYAIYAVPEGAWGDFGAHWLGWDSRSGHEVAPHPHSDWTKRPRNYGFHATLKAPFALAQGCSVKGLLAATAEIAAQYTPVPLPSLRLEQIGWFFALTAPDQRAALRPLADDLVTTLDPFRAPMAQAELTRRRRSRLSDAQDAMLHRWGYPHVLDTFQFHLTLTGRVTDPDTARAVLTDALAEPMRRPLALTDVCVMREDTDGRFHVIERCALTGGR